MEKRRIAKSSGPVNGLHDPHVGALLEEAVYHVQHVRLGLSAGDSEAATAS